MRQGASRCGRQRHRIAWPSLLLAFFLCAFLYITPARCAVSNNTESTESVAREEHLPELDNINMEELGTCPVFPFPLLLASAMGQLSTTHALATCATTPYSTILHDVLQNRRRYDAATTAASLWRLTHGNTGELSFYENAPDFLSLRAEMEAWIRANRTVGMSPPAYEAVVRGAAAVLGLNTSLLTTPTVELPASCASLSAGEVVNWTLRMAECGAASDGSSVPQTFDRDTCMLRVAQEAYRCHANTSLSTAASSLLVSNATFMQAQRYHEHAVFPSVVVRSFDLHPDTTTYGFDRSLRDLLRGVQHLWEATARDVAAEVERADATTHHFPTPYLPFVWETDFTGPRRPETRTLADSNPDYPAPSRHSGLRLQALRRILPAAVLYQTGANCTSCHLFDRAFDILPAVYKRMCSRSYRSIVSCSPVTLFLRTTHVRSFQLLPSIELYARLAYSRVAVLSAAEQMSFRVSFSDDDVEAEGAGGNDDDADELDDEVRGSLFYSLRARYSQRSNGMEEEVLPRTQFHPQRVPLRMQPDATTVEEALVGIISDLVGSGVIQFLFLDPTEVSQIARENERVRRMVEEQLQQQQQQQQKEESEKVGADETNNTAEAEAEVKKPATRGPAPTPSPNPEEHPQYRKVVSFRDLATKLVASHTHAIFGDVHGARGHPEGRSGRGSPSPSSWSSLLASSLSLVFHLPRAVWELLVSGIERPLYMTVFVLLCLYQRWWNRSQRVSYW